MARKKKGFLGLVIAIVVLASLILSGVLIAMPKAEIQVSHLAVEPKEVEVGDSVVVSADIENRGGADGEHQATLLINGEVWETKSLSVPAKSTQDVSFTVTPTSLGEYKIALDGLTAVFFVREGMLPSLYTGDRWVYRVSAEEKSEVSYEVVGEANIEGKVVYVLEVEASGKSPLDPYDKSTLFLDKGTLYPVREELSGMVGDNIILYKKMVVERRLVEGEPWPLIIGDGWKVTWSENFDSRNGLVLTSGESETSRTFRVEGSEDITTAAGDFHCLKVIERDETHKVVGTAWYSDKTKMEVRQELIIQDVPVTYELISYEVSTTAPAASPPKVEIPSTPTYDEPTFGYTVSYLEDWELTPGESKEGEVYIFTSSGAKTLRFAWLRIWPMENTDKLTLDEQFDKVMAETEEADPNFELVDSFKVEAELPWYEAEWNTSHEVEVDSEPQDIALRGKTMITLKEDTFFMLTGWVQADYSEDYWTPFNEVIDSFGFYY